MQNLQTDFAIGRGIVNRIGHDTVSCRFFFSVQFRGGRQGFAILAFQDQTPFLIWRDATGDNHAYTTLCPLCIERCHSLKPIGLLLETGVHRAHDAAIAQLCMTKIERGEQRGILGVPGQIDFGVHKLVSIFV